MFEQESYNNATQVESQDSDLFRNYEIRNWNYSSTLYKILAISAVLNIAVLAFIGQTNLLTLRGCDSPFVGRVCQVLDMAYVGTVLFGTEREYVDMEYDKTDLGDAEITYIDVSGETPPLYYPADYFQIANPVQFAMLQQQGENTINLTNSTPGINIPGFSIPRNNDSDLLNQRGTPPTPNQNAYQDDGDTNPFKVDNGTNAGVRRKPRNRPSVTPADNPKKDKKDDDGTVAEVKPDTQPTPAASPTDPVTERVINRLPLKQLALKLVERSSKDQLNLGTPFLVKASGKLSKDGKLEAKSFKYSKAESSDPQIIRDVQDGIEAFNDSGFLQYLSDLSGKTLDFSLQQDETNLSAVVQSEVGETRARSLATALSIGVDWKIAEKEKAITKMEQENNPAKAADLQNDKDDLELLKNLKVEPNGKNVVITFNVPKNVVLAMIKRKLDEQAAEVKKPSGNASSKPEGNTAIK